MNDVPAEVVEKIRKQVLEQQEESFGIKVKVRDWSSEDVTFTIQLLFNLPYIEIRSIDFKVKTPNGREMKTMSKQKSQSEKGNNESAIVEPLDMKVPYNMIRGLVSQSISKGLELHYEMVLVVALKTKGNFANIPIPITTTGKIKLPKLNEICKSSSISFKNLGKVIWDKVSSTGTNSKCFGINDH